MNAGKIGTPWKRAIEAAPGTQFVGLPKKSSTMPLRRFVSWSMMRPMAQPFCSMSNISRTPLL